MLEEALRRRMRRTGAPCRCGEMRTKLTRRSLEAAVVERMEFEMLDRDTAVVAAVDTAVVVDCYTLVALAAVVARHCSPTPY